MEHLDLLSKKNRFRDFVANCLVNSPRELDTISDQWESYLDEHFYLSFPKALQKPMRRLAAVILFEILEEQMWLREFEDISAYANMLKRSDDETAHLIKLLSQISSVRIGSWNKYEILHMVRLLMNLRTDTGHEFRILVTNCDCLTDVFHLLAALEYFREQSPALGCLDVKIDVCGKLGNQYSSESDLLLPQDYEQRWYQFWPRCKLFEEQSGGLALKSGYRCVLSFPTGDLWDLSGSQRYELVICQRLARSLSDFGLNEISNRLQELTTDLGFLIISEERLGRHLCSKQSFQRMTGERDILMKHGEVPSVREGGSRESVGQMLALKDDYIDLLNEELDELYRQLNDMTDELETVIDELETVQEELRISNNQLVSVNDDYSQKMEELSQYLKDYDRFTSIIDVALVYLESSGKIRFFNSKFETVYGLCSKDINRLASDFLFTENLGLLNLLREVETVGYEIKRKMTLSEGGFKIIRCFPYAIKQLQSRGALFCIQEINQSESQLNGLT